MEFDQIAILLLGPTALLLALCHDEGYRKWGPVLGLSGQGFWFYTLYSHGQWGAFIAGFAYTGSWMWGLWKHWETEIKNVIHRRT